MLNTVPERRPCGSGGMNRSSVANSPLSPSHSSWPPSCSAATTHSTCCGHRTPGGPVQTGRQYHHGSTRRLPASATPWIFARCHVQSLACGWSRGQLVWTPRALTVPMQSAVPRRRFCEQKEKVANFVLRLQNLSSVCRTLNIDVRTRNVELRCSAARRARSSMLKCRSRSCQFFCSPRQHIGRRTRTDSVHSCPALLRLKAKIPQ